MKTPAEKYRLTWTSRTDHFQNIYAEFFEQQILCDLTVVTEDGTFKVHRLVLAACSQYFRNILKDISVTQYPVLCLPEITSQEFQNILDYMYKGEVVISLDSITKFIHICELFRVEGIGDEQSKDSSASDETTYFNGNSRTNDNTHDQKKKLERKLVPLIEPVSDGKSPDHAKSNNDCHSTPDSNIFSQIESDDIYLLSDDNEEPMVIPDSSLARVQNDDKDATVIKEKKSESANSRVSVFQAEFMESLNLIPLPLESDEEISLVLSPTTSRDQDQDSDVSEIISTKRSARFRKISEDDTDDDNSIKNNSNIKDKSNFPRELVVIVEKLSEALSCSNSTIHEGDTQFSSKIFRSNSSSSSGSSSESMIISCKTRRTFPKNNQSMRITRKRRKLFE